MWSRISSSQFGWSRRQKIGVPAQSPLERLENRRLLSGYTLSTLGSFSDNFRSSALVFDSKGNLFGTSGGGAHGDGKVFEIAKGTIQMTDVASFNGTNGASPTGVVFDSSGNLFGATTFGGTANDGTLFEIARGTTAITTLATFDGVNGANPASAVLDSHGNLFGSCSASISSGTIFELARGSRTITTLVSYSGYGFYNQQPLAVDSADNIFGTAPYGGGSGGSSGNGTVFEVAHGTKAITTIAAFNATDQGVQPFGGCVLDSHGNLFGTCDQGGTSGAGTVFELARHSTKITALASFNGTNGSGPSSPLVIDPAGDLYGTTNTGGMSSQGGVFEVAHGTKKITALASFTGSNGALPNSAVALNSKGDVFGMTGTGGVDNYPALFEVAHGSHAITMLAPFDQIGGADPNGLVSDSSGNLFGTTSLGGDLYLNVSGQGFYLGAGTVFEIAHGSDSVTTLASFNTSDASIPNSRLVVDSSGNLFGTTSPSPNNSDQGNGTVFEIAHHSTTITTLATFDSTNGGGPSGVILDSRGNLFGTASFGGAGAMGYLFEIAHGKTGITSLASFDGTNGASPDAVWQVDSKGTVYGTTSAGGDTNGDGTIFKYVPGTTTISTIALLNGKNGSNADALLEDSHGNLYGTAFAGGDANGDGTVFEIARGTNKITTIASFDGTDGSGPSAAFFDSSGNLFGTTLSGGAHGGGTIFEIPHGSKTITTLASLIPSDGSGPNGLAMEPGGVLYGTTQSGGINNVGTFFELSPAPKVSKLTK